MDGKVSDLERLFVDSSLIMEYMNDLEEKRKQASTLEADIQQGWNELGGMKNCR